MMTEVETRYVGNCIFKGKRDGHCYKLLSNRKIRCQICSDTLWVSALDRNRDISEKLEELKKEIQKSERRIHVWSLKQYLSQEITQWMIAYFTFPKEKPFQTKCPNKKHCNKEAEDYCYRDVSRTQAPLHNYRETNLFPLS